MRSEGYCSWVCVCVCLLSHISPLERLFVLKLLLRTQQATEVKKYVGFSLKPLPSKVMALFAYLWHPTAILQRYSAQLSTAELSKALKKANSRLNTTWNTTQCKAASFFLFSLRLLLTNLLYTFRYTHFSSACAFRIHARVAPRVLHFSAFICTCIFTCNTLHCTCT